MSVERLFNIGHPHDSEVETYSIIVAFSVVGILLVLFGIGVGIKYLIYYFKGGKKK